MPGRGQYWKKGGLVDETVKEEDLSQALQTKVNTGGGAMGVFELIKTVSVVSDIAKAQITLDTPIDFVDYSEIELVVNGVVKNGDTRLELTLNDDAFNSQYAWVGAIAGGGASAFVQNTSDPSWRMDNANLADDTIFYIKLVLSGGATLQNNFRRGTGTQVWENVSNALISSIGGLEVNGNIGQINQVSSFEVEASGVGDVGAGTILSVFGKKIV